MWVKRDPISRELHLSKMRKRRLKMSLLIAFMISAPYVFLHDRMEFNRSGDILAPSYEWPDRAFMGLIYGVIAGILANYLQKRDDYQLVCPQCESRRWGKEACPCECGGRMEPLAEMERRNSSKTND